jgi:predicted Zn-dependent protease
MGTSVFERGWVQDRLDRAIASLGGETEGAEAVFRGTEAHHSRIAESAMFQAGHIEEGRLTLRAVIDGREARAMTTDLSDEGLKLAGKMALERVRAAPGTSAPTALSSPNALPDTSEASTDLATAYLDAPTKARWLAEALSAHQRDDLALAGRFHTGLHTTAVRSSTGVDAFHQGSFSDLALSALERPAGHRASSYRARCDARVDEAVIDAMWREVKDECERAHDPQIIDPGSWDVVLAPAAVTEVLEWLGEIAFTSKSVDDGMSFISDHVGDQVTGEAITITDDASMPHGVGVPIPFDVEGQPKTRVELVSAGVARGIVHDTLSAQKAGCQSTGHAQVDDEFPASGSRPGHLHITPGTASIEDLISQVERGLFITRLHYVNGMIEPRRAVMTGLLRDGAFLIENGKLGSAVQTLRFTDSILEAFGRIPGAGGVSRDVEAHTSWFNPRTCHVAPYLLVPGLAFTSGR